MPRKITDPYEVLGLHRGATDADVRAAYLRLAKKHHPDKNPGDKASEWIFKEVQRAYETLRDANDIRSAGQGRPPRAQEGEHAPPGDRAERDQRERAERDRQWQQRSERTKREEYKPREQQQAPAAGNRREPAQSQPGAKWARMRVWIAAPVRHFFDLRELGWYSRSEPTCHCGSVVRWTRLPRFVRLIGAWVQWALRVVAGTFFYAMLLIVGVVALESLWGLPSSSIDASALVTFWSSIMLAFGVVLWAIKRPRVCQECGRVSIPD